MNIISPTIILLISLSVAVYVGKSYGAKEAEDNFLAAHTSILLSIHETTDEKSEEARQIIITHLRDSVVPLFIASQDLPRAEKSFIEVTDFLYDHQQTHPLYTEQEIEALGKDRGHSKEMLEHIQTQAKSKNELFTTIMAQLKARKEMELEK